jgi:hypothetical protein
MDRPENPNERIEGAEGVKGVKGVKGVELLGKQEEAYLCRHPRLS